MIKKFFCLLIAFFMMIGVVACNTTEGNQQGTKKEVKRYEGPFVELNGAYGGVDDLGRVLSDNSVVGDVKERQVGIFYFLWMGEHGRGGPYDNSAIVESYPDAIKSEENWLAAGGGPRGAHHFWGEPLLGYYLSEDEWVMRKHLQMLTDAGVDFIVFDATNAFTYDARVRELIEIWHEYLEMGVDVPKLAFYTNSSSGQEASFHPEISSTFPKTENYNCQNHTPHLQHPSALRPDQNKWLSSPLVLKSVAFVRHCRSCPENIPSY